MQYGITLPGRGPLSTPDNLATIAQRAEALGFDSIALGDHILVPKSIDSDYPYTEDGAFPGSASGQAMEQITALAYMAGCTSSIRLATSVLIVPHRNPLVAAKALATLDVLSGGRLIVGVGVGWCREEFEAVGCEPFDERGAVTDEYIRAFKELWTSDDPTFEGQYVSFSDIWFLPKPVQKPHPPFWVGGESRPAIRRAATLCDGWYPIGNNPAFPVGTPEALENSIGRLHRTAERAGRNPDEIQRRNQAPPGNWAEGFPTSSSAWTLPTTHPTASSSSSPFPVCASSRNGSPIRRASTARRRPCATWSTFSLGLPCPP